MRRTLHWCLVVVLSLSLWTDAARAGWHHRRAWHPVPSGCLAGGWSDVPVAVMGCCEPAGEVIEPGWNAMQSLGDGWETVGCPEPLCCEPEGEEIVGGLSEAVGDPEPVHLTAPAELVPAVRVDEVEPSMAGQSEASVLVPEGELKQAAESQLTRQEPVVHDPLQMESPDTAADAEPAAELEPPLPKPEPEPVNIFEAEEESEAALEPIRRWINGRGDHSLVARFVGQPTAVTCLLEVGSRTITVPLDNLSPHDRAYVDRAVERLAAARTAAQPLDTAGL